MIPIVGVKNLTQQDKKDILKASKKGDIEEMKRIVENRGLTWLDGTVETSQLKQLNSAHCVQSIQH